MPPIKSENNIDSIKALILKMTPHEINILKGYLKLRAGKSDNKYEKLLRLLLSKRNYSNAGIKSKVSPESSENTYRVFLMRFKDKALEALNFDLVTSKTGAFSPSFRNVAKVRRLLTTAEIVYSKGLFDEAMYQYNRCEHICRKYELYEEQLTILKRKKYMLLIRNGVEHTLKINEQIDSLEKKLKLFEEAKTSYYTIANRIEFSAINHEFTDYFFTQISKLKYQNDLLKSDRVQYQINQLFIAYYNHIKEHESALEIAEANVKFIKKSPPVYIERRVGSASIVCANSLVATHQFAKAIAYCNQGIRYLEEGTFNFLNALEVKFYALFYSGNFDLAETIIRDLLKATDKRTHPKHFSKRSYLLAAVQFKKGEYKNAHLRLQRTKDLDDDKEGWNPAIRILSIINQIERGGIGMVADIEIKRLASFACYLNRGENLSARNKLILHLLLALMKESFNFNTVAKQKKLVLQKLSLGKEDYEWNMASPELIRFDAWFMAKTKNVEYCYDFALNS